MYDFFIMSKLPLTPSPHNFLDIFYNYFSGMSKNIDEVNFFKNIVLTPPLPISLQTDSV